MLLEVGNDLISVYPFLEQFPDLAGKAVDDALAALGFGQLPVDMGGEPGGFPKPVCRHSGALEAGIGAEALAGQGRLLAGIVLAVHFVKGDVINGAGKKSGPAWRAMGWRV